MRNKCWKWEPTGSIWTLWSKFRSFCMLLNCCVNNCLLITVTSFCSGHFVPNLTFGPPVISSLRKAHPNSYIDCHLMVSEPAKWIEPLKQAGATSLTFHIESDLPGAGPKQMIEMIHDAGMKAGMVVKPGTPVEVLYPYVDFIDLALIMTVEPGFSGQQFQPEMMTKVTALRERCPNMTIQVDGGLTPSTVEIAGAAGANAIVAATAIFGAKDRKAAIDELRAGVQKYQS